jgi:hypothetical protein
MEDHKYAEFAHDVFVTACEGGINHWADVSNYFWLSKKHSHMTWRGWSAKLTVDNEDNSFSVYPLNWWTIMTGTQRLMKEYKENPPEDHNVREIDKVAKALLLADLTDDYESIGATQDADWADIIVQYGLFGELVYG